MSLLSNINFITVLIIFIFMMPVAAGLLDPLSRSGIRHSMLSIINWFNFIISVILAFRLIRFVFSDTKNWLIIFLNRYIPSVGELIYQYRQDIVAYAIAIFIFTSVIHFILGLLTIPFSKHVIFPLAGGLSSALDLADPKIRRIFSGLWELPKSVFMVLVFTLLLNFYASFINNPSADDYINASKAYQSIHKNLLTPILSADLVKKTPVLISEAFRKAAEDFTPANADKSEDTNYWNLPAIKYFNGVTIDEAVTSTTEIDNAAKQIVGNETDDVEKARLLYEWISKTIKYDNAKAAIVLKNPSRVESGSIITFKNKTGVCFDYASLYVSMSRAVGVRVRMISGLGYNGKEWAEHVWNQVYDPEEDRWLNVDTTFGASGYNYFDNPGFAANHKYDVVQAEW